MERRPADKVDESQCDNDLILKAPAHPDYGWAAFTDLSSEILSQKGLVRRLIEDDRCVYCLATMQVKMTHGVELGGRLLAHSPNRWHLSSERADPIERPEYEEVTWHCSQCGWWKHILNIISPAEEIGPLADTKQNCRWAVNFRSQIVVYGVLKKFNLASADLPLMDLRRWLVLHPDDAAQLNPFLFERLISDCFRDSGNYTGVRLIGGRGDRGIDLILLEGDEPIIVQVKRRAGTGAVEKVRGVRELNGVLLREGVPRGMIITTAGRFSRGAREEVELNRLSYRGVFKRYNVDLVSMQELRAILTRGDRVTDPWLRHRYLPSHECHWIEKMIKLLSSPWD